MSDTPGLFDPNDRLGAIKRVEIYGFKSISNASIDLEALNILIGPNGAGKSNLIGVFQFLKRIAERKLADHVARGGYASRFLHFGPKRTPSLRIRIEFESGRNWYDCELAPNAQDALYFSQERFGYSGDKGYQEHAGKTPSEITLGAGHPESKLDDEIADRPKGSIALNVKRWLTQLRLYHFHDTSSTADLKRAGPIHDNRSLNPNAGNLAAFLFTLKQTSPAAYQSIVGAVGRIAPFFEDFSLAPDMRNPEVIRLQWKDRASEDYFDAASLSDGTLRFICLATLLLQPTLPSIVLIDEPELGLHPAAIVLLAELLRSASKRNAQIIVSTQSTTLVNQMRPEDVLVVENQNGKSTFNRLSTEKLTGWLGDYGLGDLWEKNLLGGRP